MKTTVRMLLTITTTHYNEDNQSKCNSYIFIILFVHEYAYGTSSFSMPIYIEICVLAFIM